jgi:hypothetical protein
MARQIISLLCWAGYFALLGVAIVWAVTRS